VAAIGLASALTALALLAVRKYGNLSDLGKKFIQPFGYAGTAAAVVGGLIFWRARRDRIQNDSALKLASAQPTASVSRPALKVDDSAQQTIAQLRAQVSAHAATIQQLRTASATAQPPATPAVDGGAQQTIAELRQQLDTQAHLIAARDQTIQQHVQTIAAREQTIQQHVQTIEARDQTVRQLREESQARQATIERQQARLDRLETGVKAVVDWEIGRRAARHGEGFLTNFGREWQLAKTQIETHLFPLVPEASASASRSSPAQVASQPASVASETEPTSDPEA
jgi:hypothetical protein